ncbi:MAG TPA: hypothetical protein VF911_03910 [Thermoanaerobaculia bacterium]
MSSLALRADRAMRTLVARNVAAAVYAATNDAMLHARPSRDLQNVLLTALAARRGWKQRSAREFVHTFGSRQSTITIPLRFDAPVLAALVTRTEIAVLLGDCERPLVAALQALAARELQHLCARDAA